MWIMSWSTLSENFRSLCGEYDDMHELKFGELGQSIVAQAALILNESPINLFVYSADFGKSSRVGLVKASSYRTKNVPARVI